MNHQNGYVFTTCLVLCVSCGPLVAQQLPQLPQRGVVPNGFYDLSQIETVDTVSGNVSLHIPLAKLPPSRAGFSTGIDLYYNSSIWSPSESVTGQGTDYSLQPDNTVDPPSTYGWRYGFQYSLVSGIIAPPTDVTLCNEPGTMGFRMILPDGSSHTLYSTSDYGPGGTVEYYYSVNQSTGQPQCVQYPTGTYYTADGTYLAVSICLVGQSGCTQSGGQFGWTLYFPDGRVVAGVDADTLSIADRDGNVVSVTNETSVGSSQTSAVLTDVAGRTITLTYNASAPVGCPANSISGDTITVAGYGGIPLQTSVCWSSYSASGPPTAVTDGAGPPWSVFAVSQITLPDSLSYAFQYSSNWGQIDFVTLPTQASVAYSFASDYGLAYSNFRLGEIQSKQLSWMDQDTGQSRTEQTTYCFTEPVSGGACPLPPGQLHQSTNTASSTSSAITHPDGGITAQWFYAPTSLLFGGVDPNYPFVENETGLGTYNPFAGLVYEVMEPNGDTQERVWQQNVPYGSCPICNSSQQTTPFHDAGNPYVAAEYRSVANGGQQILASAKGYTYDRNGNQLAISESDWFPYSSINRATIPFQTFSPADGDYPPPTLYTGAFLRTTGNTYLNSDQTSAVPSGSQQPVQDPSGYSTDDAYGYWHLRSPQLLNLPVQTSLATGSGGSLWATSCPSGYLACTEYSYDNNSYGASYTVTHGDITTIHKFNNASGGDDTTTNSYDGNGNILTSIDARGAKTTFSYDAGSILNCPGSVTGNLGSLYVSQAQQTDVNGSPVLRTHTYTHDCSSGVLLSLTDNDHGSTTDLGYDQYGRNTCIQEGVPGAGSAPCQPTGTNSIRNTNITYYDNSLYIKVQTDLNSAGDQALTQYTYYDPLGRVRQTVDPAGNAVQTTYYTPQGGGYNYELASNPYLSTGSTSGWTLTTKDPENRVTSVKHFDGPTLPAPWGSNGNSTGNATTTYAASTTSPTANTYCTTNTDEAGVQRIACSDGPGRLAGVTESGISAFTSYAYDGQDDLTLVCQGGTISGASCSGGVARNFTYSSLKRLNSATNPESGQILYTYDAVGNLSTKTDARSITTTYTYDGLNENLTKSYSDGTTPGVTYTYNHGWLAQVASVLNSVPVSAYAYTQDLIGRVNGGTQTTGGQNYTFNVSLTPFVGIGSITYPNANASARRTMTTTYGDGSVPGTKGLPVALTGQIGAGTPTNYVTSAQYAPQGVISLLPLANGLTEQTCFNGRLQPLAKRIGTAGIQTNCNSATGDLLNLQYGYSATANNGNVLSQAITRGSQTWTDSYSYDGGNRLTTASETVPGSWTQSFGYDTRGNRWLTSIGPVANSASAELITSNTYNANNRISTWDSPSCYGGANCYDASGNLLVVPASGGAYVRTATYDAENRQVSVTPSGNSSTTYIYDGEGRRVEKVSSVGTTVFVYDPFGNLAQEYSSAGPTDSDTKYLTTDALGSTRLITKSDGTVDRNYDYLPFGEEISPATTGRSTSTFPTGAYPEPASTQRQDLEFTSKERDAETGLDNFGARYNSSAQGRFTSPDPLMATPLRVINPQRWNMYAYAVNNPLSYVDPDGRDAIAVNFSKMVGGAGHEGIISIHSDGRAEYARFGPVGGNKPFGEGEVKTFDLGTVAVGGDGFPTTSGYQQMATQVARFEGTDPNSVRMNYFRTSEADTLALDQWIKRIKDASDQRKAPGYDVTRQNCTVFCIVGLLQANAIQNKNISLVPNRLFDLLSGVSSENYSNGRVEKIKQPKACVETDAPGGGREKVCQ